MRYLVLLSLLGATCLGAQPAPAGVDALSPDDVSKAISAVKESFVRPEALSDTEMARSTLQGLLDRLSPEVSLVTGTAGAETASPFYSEASAGNTGYLRPGQLTEENVAKAKQALKDWSGKSVGAVVLDLRGTPPSSDYDAGADLARLFCAKGTEMFSLAAGKGQAVKTSEAGSSPASSPSPAQAYSADADPVFQGVLIVLVDDATSEAPEAVAASLQKCAKALVVGDKTAGRAFEYRDYPLDGAVLRVAVARVILPDGKEPGEDGLKPDIDVAPGVAPKEELMRSISTKGVKSVIEEHDLPHLNEAALVAGSNPEVDELEAEEAGKKPEEGLIDPQLQRALDLVTSISIYQAKKEAGADTGK
jgi:C-terminal processing protease CtpA/Prc